jgi:GAF domain-containing protein
MSKEEKYKHVVKSIEVLINGETDTISKMSTIACELFQNFEYWNWIGFYRLVDDKTLKVGPYQGTHGCLTIDINQGVCGKCAREKKVQIENDVAVLPHHIACSPDTKAEIVLPIINNEGSLRAVLDIDSLELNCFDEIDVQYLTIIADMVY